MCVNGHGKEGERKIGSTIDGITGRMMESREGKGKEGSRQGGREREEGGRSARGRGELK